MRALKPGGTIGVFAPGSAVDPVRYRAGVLELENRGYCVVAPLDPGANYGRYDFAFSSASVEDRVSAFHSLLSDDEVDLIVAARGAYGSAEMLPKIDFSLAANSKKMLVGCSDVTAILLPLWEKSGLCGIHGATVSGDFRRAVENEDAKNSIESLLELVSDEDYRFLVPATALRAGRKQGRILAGNLTVLLGLLGTPWDVDYREKILVIEEIAEAPYRIHRMLLQLQLAGKFDNLSGLVFGNFARCVSDNGPTVEEVIEFCVADMLPKTEYPVLCGFPSGHKGINFPLPIGAMAEISQSSLRLLESPLER